MTTQSRAWAKSLALAGATLVPGVAAAQQPPATTAATSPATEYGKRVVAYVHGGTPVYRRELGDFLIARGGMEKVELLLNKRVIEIEAARRGVTVTPVEVEAALAEDLRGLGAKREEFERLVLPKYGKSLYEWTEDVIRPRLLIGKMCRDKIKVTDDDLKRAFESKYGEKREAQVIAWPKGNAKIPELSADVKAAAISKPEEFDKLAAGQPNDLAKTVGRISPIGRHIEGEDPAVEAALFSMKVGEMRWVETAATSTCIRCIAITPPDPAITFESRRGELEKEVADKKLTAAIPQMFDELKKLAAPTLTEHVPLPPPGTLPPDVKPVRVPSADPRVLGVCYGNLPVTRDDLGEFLIARGGYEKLDLLVNRKIIDMEAARAGISLSQEELDAAFAADLKGLGVTKDDFIKVVLPKYGKTLYEWTEDAIRPRETLAKMCRAGVKVTDDDLQRAFEGKYGEKRQAKVILWGKDELRQAQKLWDEARKGDNQFDSVARAQRDPTLAAAAGLTAPVGRHTDAESTALERILFSLNVGEVSQLFETPAGVMCVKCVAILPPQAGVTLAQVKADLEREVFDKKLAKAIPAHFGELRAKANPNLLMKGPPSDRENREGVEQIIRQAGATVPKP